MKVRWLILVTLTFLLLSWAPAHGESVKVRDNEPGHEAYFLAIKSARFSNTGGGIAARALHPSLVPDYVDRFELWMLNGKSRRSTQQDRYILRRAGARVSLLRQSPGQENPSRVACRGDRIRVVAATDSRPGRVVMRVPRRCVPRSKFLRFGYLVHNEGGNVTDTAPGGTACCYPELTRWVRRG